MNRKKTAKINKAAYKWHPYDLPENWARGDFAEPPWSREKIRDFQKRIDSAFGAEEALVLVWSGDRSYGDEFYDGPWDTFGNPIGKLVKKPVLLFGEVQVGLNDVCYISPARWCLMEVHHGSQLEASWDDSAWVSDETKIGGRRRIRSKKPPEKYYVHLVHGVLAHHEVPHTTGAVPPCCLRMWEGGKRICYGKYREPNESDIAMIRGIRERMDAAGVAQRSDTPRDAKMLAAANLSTQHFMKQAAHRQWQASRDLVLSNVNMFCGDLLKDRGSTMSNKELERVVKSAFDQEEQELFSRS